MNKLYPRIILIAASCFALLACGSSSPESVDEGRQPSSTDSSEPTLPSSNSSSIFSSSSSLSSTHSSSSSVAQVTLPFAFPAVIQAQTYQRASQENDERMGALEGPCATGEVDLGETTDEAGECFVGWTIPGEWLEWDLQGNSAGQFDITMRIATNEPGKKVTVLLDGMMIETASVVNAGWTQYQDLVIKNVTLTALEQTLRVHFDTGGVNLNYVAITDSQDVSNACTPAPLQMLDSLPINPALSNAPNSVAAAFEVDGNRLISTFVRDTASAQLGLKYWQKMVTRVPFDVRRDIVQFNVIGSSDPVGWFSGDGSNQTGREGYSIAISQILSDTLGKPCDPLTPRRGTFDWTLVHELAHMRTLLTQVPELFNPPYDGVLQPNVTELFSSRFKSPEGNEVFPPDGSPKLTGNFVTSYAQQEAGGDEEVAEVFTTYIMIDPLPSNGSTVAAKLKFMDSIPGFSELKTALRQSN